MTDLWTFAVQLYQHDSVKQNCLALQDSAGVDVCLLLAVVWLGRCEFTLPEDDLDVLITAINGWQQQVTVPLRSIRREALAPEALLIEAGIGEAMRALGDKVQQAELSAERVALGRLSSLAKESRWINAALINGSVDSLDVSGVGSSTAASVWVDSFSDIEGSVKANVECYLRRFQALSDLAIEKAARVFVDAVFSSAVETF